MHYINMADFIDDFHLMSDFTGTLFWREDSKRSNVLVSSL